MKRKTKEKIQFNLKYIAMLVIILFLLFSLAYKGMISRKMENDVLEDIHKEVDLISKEVDIFFARYYEIIEQMDTNELFYEYVKQSEIDGYENNLLNDTVDTLKKIKNSDDDIGLVWVGLIKENNIVGDDLKWKVKENFNITERPWYQDMVSGEDFITFATPYIDEGTDKPIVSIVKPITENGEIIGVLGMDIQIDKLVEFISTYKMDNGGFVILTTSCGELVASAKPINEVKLISDYIANNNFGDSCDVIELKEEYSDTYFFTYENLDLSDWKVSIAVPKNNTRYLINLFNILSWIIFGIFLLMLVILGVMLKLSTNLTDLNLLYSKLRNSEKELQESNEEMNAAYQQLSASEEELQSQYDEIQSYVTRIEELKNKYDLAIELTNISVWDYNVVNREVRFNNAFFTNTELLDGQYYDIDLYMSDVLDENNYELVLTAFKQYMDDRNEALYTQLNLNGNWYLLQGRFCERDEKELLSGTIIDITKIKKQEAEIEKLANIDPLTDIPNRRNFKGVLQKSIDDGMQGAVILLDLDNFKEINDTMGHVFGDFVLKDVAKKLKSVESDKLRVSRFGGDEFLLEIFDVKDKNEIIYIMKSLINKFRKKIIIEDEIVFITMSMGITMYPEDSGLADELIMNADLAMYSVKTTGKNNYAFYSSDMRTKAKDRTRIEKILRQAIDHDGFKLLYQPQVEVETGKICSSEALIRLKEYNISPGEFIPIAEDNGIVIPIGRWVTEKVISQLSKWQDSGYDIKPVSINFSAKQLADDKYFDFLTSMLEKYRVNPKYIEIEITESIFFDEEIETIELLEKLRSLGITISLDDFGTGYSSFSYLTYLPLDKLKLDKSLSERFIANNNEEVIESMIALAHSIGLKVIAEGIETKEQFDVIRDSDGDIIQGYYFSKPIEADKMIKLEKFEM